MRRRVPLFSLLLTSLALGAVDGTVRNQTTGKPQADAVITLVELGGGMKNIGSVKSGADGVFRFDADLQATTPYLIQALHQGVTYNRTLAPGSSGTGLTLEVYDAAPKAPEAKVSQDMILLEKSGSELLVNETVIYTNTGSVTLQNPDGNLKIKVPAAVTGPVRMRITAPQGMPITREPEKGKEPGILLVRYPIKPGETRIDFSYTMPAPEQTTKFESRILHGGGPVRFVAPQGVKLDSPALTDLGPEPRTQASVYEMKGTQAVISISGSGQLRAPSGEGERASGEAGGEDNTPGIDAAKPRLFTRLTWVVGLAFAMMAVGFAFMYSKGPQA